MHTTRGGGAVFPVEVWFTDIFIPADSRSDKLKSICHAFEAMVREPRVKSADDRWRGGEVRLHSEVRIYYCLNHLNPLLVDIHLRGQYSTKVFVEVGGSFISPIMELS